MTWLRLTRRPAIDDAVGFAPTTWNRRPNVVNRKITTITRVIATPIQKIRVTPRNLVDVHSDNASGTGVWIAVVV